MPDTSDATLLVGNSDGQVAAADWCKCWLKQQHVIAKCNIPRSVQRVYANSISHIYE